ncbi:hypothetical protein TYRP_001391 [Tyrophagus putrescentiae]|nr:hypothetical protein TYRP_001391 [Tyrophagus putrescentiae]
MDFQSMMETFAEAWVAANTQTPLTEAAAAAADHPAANTIVSVDSLANNSSLVIWSGSHGRFSVLVATMLLA